ncbi:hypothetical protein [Streptomyces sp. NBC_00328]|uniref:hypothetical protein n=1 Tax=Streptomyces sp. NBC_00328 TaxID=2903646 RepID=UPI002E29E357|nr:hypothetical protein [Streptomyces sp. NBC_00328]
MESDDLWRNMRPVHDVVAAIESDGSLTLRHESGQEAFVCGPAGAVMWITLQRHGWRLGAAAQELGRLWSMDALWVRVVLGCWLENLLEEGLVMEV